VAVAIALVSNVAKRWLGRLIGSCDVVRNPSLKSERNVRRRLTALQGEVAGADQMAHYAVADPNRQAPQPHAGPCAMRLHPLGGRRPPRILASNLATYATLSG
jgi:hypothetical protein